MIATPTTHRDRCGSSREHREAEQTFGDDEREEGEDEDEVPRHRRRGAQLGEDECGDGSDHHRCAEDRASRAPPGEADEADERKEQDEGDHGRVAGGEVAGDDVEVARDP